MSSVLQEVLTLDEVAKYLRLPKKTIEQQAIYGKIPGRRIEKSWRFLKEGIDRWLQSHDSRDVLLYQAGSLEGDETLAGLRASIYAERGRAEADTTEEP